MLLLNANVQGAGLTGLIFPIAILAIFYFMAIRPQKKREKEITEMRDSLKVGDKIITIGGINAKIIKVKEDMITVEVGSDRTKMDMTKWAVGSVVNRDVKADNEKEEERAKAKEEKEKAKSDKDNIED